MKALKYIVLGAFYAACLVTGLLMGLIGALLIRGAIVL